MQSTKVSKYIFNKIEKKDDYASGSESKISLCNCVPAKPVKLMLMQLKIFENTTLSQY